MRLPSTSHVSPPSAAPSRSTQPQEPAAGHQVPQQSGLADNEGGDDRPVTVSAVADEMAQGTIPEAHP
jgi:hypothetical protein